jgi:hypothetical protein
VSRTGGQSTLIARVVRVPALRRVVAGFAAFSFSENATWLAILVYAMQRGGAREVGIVAVAQLVPGIVLAPFAAYAGDKFAPQRALAIGYAAQSASMAATAAAMAADAPLVAYIAGGCAATAITFTRPVMGSLLPTITHAPRELVAANMVTGFIEQVGVFVGPLLAGAVMALSTPGAVFAVAAVATALGCVAVLLIDPIETAARAPELETETVVAQVFAGFSTLRREGRLRVLVWLGVTAGFVKGIGDVIFVTFADERLDGGGAESGLLAGAYGLGALAGAVGIGRLVRSGRVSGQFVLAGLLASVPLLALAGISGLALALAGFALLGAGETLLGLTSSLTIQRQAPTAVLARVFGILEGMQMGAIAIGSLGVTALVAWTAIGPAFAMLAVFVLLTVLGGVARLRRHGDGPQLPDETVVERLLDDPVFAPLPAPTIERLARNSESRSYEAGCVVVEQGTTGDRYYLVDDGRLAVSIDGVGIRELGPGTSFGEIALLRDVPRQATVVADTDLVLRAIDRRVFLLVVTGHAETEARAEHLVTRVLVGS